MKGLKGGFGWKATRDRQSDRRLLYVNTTLLRMLSDIIQVDYNRAREKAGIEEHVCRLRSKAGEDMTEKRK